MTIDNKRRHERTAVTADASLWHDDSWSGCRIINISMGGAKLNIDLPLRAGHAVRLKIGSFGDFNGVVTWSGCQEVGIRFTQDPSEVAAMVLGLATYA